MVVRIHPREIPVDGSQRTQPPVERKRFAHARGSTWSRYQGRQANIGSSHRFAKPAGPKGPWEFEPPAFRQIRTWRGIQNRRDGRRDRDYQRPTPRRPAAPAACGMGSAPSAILTR